VLKSSSHRWSEADKRLMDLGPRNVMSRGFSILRTADGDLVRDYKNVKPGDRLEVLLDKGKLLVEVKESDKDWW
ncbi:MAG TPA: exodeoxyribonuclease VII large subunit, partial [Candidatus Melainabacteria bacterium]|nr:exodeoxyribonuclease VII large subunit [Candidatus Melainabacteria bacterium]